MTNKNVNSAQVVDLQQAKSAKSTKKGPKCPICGKSARAGHAPFCSKRCADVDLGKWLGEGYRIPTEEIPGFDEGLEGED